MQLRLQKAELMDRERLIEALRRLGSSFPDGLEQRMDLETLGEKLLTLGEVVFAVMGEEIAAVVAWYANDEVTRKAFLSIIVVDDRYRSQGLGKKLLVEVLAGARAKGMCQVWLKVHPDNAKAQRFYTREGFFFDGTVDGKVRMTINIDAAAREGNY